MTQEEIIQAISDDKMMPFIQPDQLAVIVDFVIKNYRPSLPSNLDEAAIQAAQIDIFDRQIMEDSNEHRMLYSRIFRRGFKAGAEWMAGQGISYDATISADKTIPVLPMKDVSNMGFDYGDNVTVQIRKK